MRETNGEDIFEQVKHADAICITTNCSVMADGSNPMAGGVAGAAARKWPQLPAIYGRLLTVIPNVPVILGWCSRIDPSHFVSIFSTIEEIAALTGDICAIVAYPTMDQIGVPADIDLVSASACLLADLADTYSWREIYLAAPGIGIGGLDYEVVRAHIKDVLDERFTVMRKDVAPMITKRNYCSDLN